MESTIQYRNKRFDSQSITVNGLLLPSNSATAKTRIEKVSEWFKKCRNGFDCCRRNQW